MNWSRRPARITSSIIVAGAVPPGEASMAGEAPTVYVLDDEADVLRALSRLLRSEGLGVRTFDDALAFLEHMDPGLAGCVLLDLSMPELDGLAVQRLLNDNGCTQPVIFLSGNADAVASASARQQGASDFLSKPVDAEELLRSVRAALEADRLVRASARAEPGR
jgi:FixJ family two-component response regulator